MRADGIKLKGADPMYTVAAHIMDKRYDAMNSITIYLPHEPVKAYVNKCRNENRPTSHLAVLLCAYIRTLTKFPELNRFVINKNIYARRDISVGMVVLKKGSLSHGTMNKVKFKITDNIDQVTKKINKYIEENSAPVEGTNATDKLVNTLLGIPGLLRFGVPFIKVLDKLGWLPQSILDASPFHESFVITNLASIKTNHIFHHCYEFGTISVFLSMGNSVEVPGRVKGEIVHEKCMPIGVVMDERIASGGYFALAFKHFEKLLKNPELLETELKYDDVSIDPNIPVNKRKYLKFFND